MNRCQGSYKSMPDSPDWEWAGLILARSRNGLLRHFALGLAVNGLPSALRDWRGLDGLRFRHETFDGKQSEQIPALVPLLNNFEPNFPQGRAVVRPIDDKRILDNALLPRFAVFIARFGRLKLREVFRPHCLSKCRAEFLGAMHFADAKGIKGSND